MGVREGHSRFCGRGLRVGRGRVVGLISRIGRIEQVDLVARGHGVNRNSGLVGIQVRKPLEPGSGNEDAADVEATEDETGSEQDEATVVTDENASDASDSGESDSDAAARARRQPQ